MIDADAFQALLREKPTLVGRIHEFNYQPARYIDQSHLAGWFDPKLLNVIIHSPRGLVELSQVILRRFKLTDSTCWDFNERRLLGLLPGPTMNSVLDYVAAAVCSRDIGRIIEKSARLQLREHLGPELLEFAVKRGPTLASTGWPDDPQLSSQPWERITQVRQACLSCWIAGEPAAYRERALLKLPAERALNIPGDVSPAQHELVWLVTRKLLRSDFREEWTACCA